MRNRFRERRIRISLILNFIELDLIESFRSHNEKIPEMMLGILFFTSCLEFMEFIGNFWGNLNFLGKWKQTICSSSIKLLRYYINKLKNLFSETRFISIYYWMIPYLLKIGSSARHSSSFPQTESSESAPRYELCISFLAGFTLVFLYSHARARASASRNCI